MRVELQAAWGRILGEQLGDDVAFVLRRGVLPGRFCGAQPRSSKQGTFRLLHGDAIQFLCRCLRPLRIEI